MEVNTEFIFIQLKRLQDTVFAILCKLLLPMLVFFYDRFDAEIVSECHTS